MARGGRFVGKILVQGWDLKSRRLFCQRATSGAEIPGRVGVEGWEAGTMVEQRKGGGWDQDGNYQSRLD